MRSSPGKLRQVNGHVDGSQRIQPSRQPDVRCDRDRLAASSLQRGEFLNQPGDTDGSRGANGADDYDDSARKPDGPPRERPLDVAPRNGNLAVRRLLCCSRRTTEEPGCRHALGLDPDRCVPPAVLQWQQWPRRLHRGTERPHRIDGVLNHGYWHDVKLGCSNKRGLWKLRFDQLQHLSGRRQGRRKHREQLQGYRSISLHDLHVCGRGQRQCGNGSPKLTLKCHHGLRRYACRKLYHHNHRHRREQPIQLGPGDFNRQLAQDFISGDLVARAPERSAS
jgi:hypothetical protein